MFSCKIYIIFVGILWSFYILHLYVGSLRALMHLEIIYRDTIKSVTSKEANKYLRHKSSIYLIW